MSFLTSSGRTLTALPSQLRAGVPGGVRAQRFLSASGSVLSRKSVGVSGVRTMSGTPTLRALSESDHDQDSETRKQAIDEHKADQARKHAEGKGHWKRELGSNSEAAIKADRNEIAGEERDIDKLQKETAAAMEEQHEHRRK